MTPKTAHRLRTILGLSLVLILLLTPASVLAQGAGPTPSVGYYYVVRPGDTWTGIALTTGVPIATIRQYNPAAIHPHYYLWIGDRLWIPALEPSHATAGYWYDVRRGDDWNSISQVTGVPVSVLMAANPTTAADRRGWLYIGQQIWIPNAPAATTTAESAAVPKATAEPRTTPTPSEVPPDATVTSGYWYEVQQGDDWWAVSQVTGVSASELKAANPAAAADPLGWLYIGQQLWIPTGPVATDTETLPGSTAAGTSTPVPTVTQPPAMAVIGTPTPRTGPEATPEPLTPVEPTATATTVPTTPPTPAATATPTTPPTSAATATPITPPTSVAAAASPTPVVRATSSAAPLSTPAAAAGVSCPNNLAAYHEAIADHLQGSNGNLKTLKAWLQGCGVITAESGDVVEFRTSDTGNKDVVVVIHKTPAGKETQGQLLAYHNTDAGYTLSHQVEGVGAIKLLKAEDINADDKPDLVYTDTSCGAHTCFSTLFVDSWDGSAFQDWTKGDPTMAGAEYSFEDVEPGGQGLEILAHGGVINSTGAGPQRAWTETYVSPENGPYESLKKSYDESSCLYFKIQDANELFDQWAEIGFAPAIAAYEKAIADKTAKACGADPEELKKLSDFARFRLILSWVSRGQSAKAAQIRSSITYAPLVGATNIFVNTMQNSRSIVQACRDVTRYAELNPPVWNYLSDWGYANPTFTGAGLCPLG
jgi:LysM repeat protein